MSHWISQTRYMNGHYQSEPQEKGGEEEHWHFGQRAYVFSGTAFSDGTYGFFSANMREPDAIGTPAAAPYDPASKSLLYGGHYVWNDRQVWIGIYTPDIYDVLCNENTVLTDLSAFQSFNDITIAGDKTAEIGAEHTINAEQMNGQTLLIPQITRYPFIYYCCYTSEELPAFLQDLCGGYEDKTMDLPSALNRPMRYRNRQTRTPEVYILLDALLPEYSMPDVPGAHPIFAEQPNATRYGTIASASYEASAVRGESNELKGNMFSANTEASIFCLPAIATGCVYNNSTGVAYAYNGHLTQISTGIIGTGGNITGYSYDPINPIFAIDNKTVYGEQYFNDGGDIYAVGGFIRRITGIKKQKNFNFWKVVI